MGAHEQKATTQLYPAAHINANWELPLGNLRLVSQRVSIFRQCYRYQTVGKSTFI